MTRQIYRLYTGMTLTLATLTLVYMTSTDIFQNSQSARYVASFIAGLFGFTAIETLRGGLGSDNELDRLDRDKFKL
jgi:cytochrome c biogenesis protein CcdA